MRITVTATSGMEHGTIVNPNIVRLEKTRSMEIADETVNDISDHFSRYDAKQRAHKKLENARHRTMIKNAAVERAQMQKAILLEEKKGKGVRSRWDRFDTLFGKTMGSNYGQGASCYDPGSPNDPLALLEFRECDPRYASINSLCKTCLGYRRKCDMCPLPPNWVQYIAPDNKKTYFYNEAERELLWSPPPGCSSATYVVFDRYSRVDITCSCPLTKARRQRILRLLWSKAREIRQGMRETVHMEELTEQLRRLKIRTAFEFYDRNNDGMIGIQELNELWKDYGSDLAPLEAVRLKRLLDQNMPTAPAENNNPPTGGVETVGGGAGAAADISSSTSNSPLVRVCYTQFASWWFSEGSEEQQD